ncbi:MAG: hypothetical protein ACK4J3_19230, partial [Acinetobacter pittii]
MSISNLTRRNNLALYANKLKVASHPSEPDDVVDKHYLDTVLQGLDPSASGEGPEGHDNAYDWDAIIQE